MAKRYKVVLWVLQDGMDWEYIIGRWIEEWNVFRKTDALK